MDTNMELSARWNCLTGWLSMAQLLLWRLLVLIKRFVSVLWFELVGLPNMTVLRSPCHELMLAIALEPS